MYFWTIRREGYNNNNNNNNQGFLGLPQGVWKSEFPVGKSFLLRGTEKKTQTLKWSGKNWWGGHWIRWPHQGREPTTDILENYWPHAPEKK